LVVDTPPVDTVRMQLAWGVSEGTHATADSLGDLSGIAVDRAGNTYVSDRRAVKIWVFDSAGRSLDAIGRSGQGPGEFDTPAVMAIDPDDRLYVRDMSYVSVFAMDTSTGRLSRFVRRFSGSLSGDWQRASRFSITNRMYYPAYTFPDRTSRVALYHIYDSLPERPVVDSLIVPPFPDAPSGFASYRYGTGTLRRFRGLSQVPFAPMPVWDVTPRGTVISGDGRTYVLRETDHEGALLREFRREVVPLQIPEQLRADSLAALDARLDSVPVPFSQVSGIPPEVIERRLPETFPAYMAVYATPEDQIWVRRWTAETGKRSAFDVFDADGTLSHVVILPRDIAAFPVPVLSSDGVAAVGVNPETGAHEIMRFKLPTPPVRP
jgi:hypothetical protein